MKKGRREIYTYIDAYKYIDIIVCIIRHNMKVFYKFMLKYMFIFISLFTFLDLCKISYKKL